jgi:DNA mismatch endonuclease (patch repair protein)
MSRVRGRNTLPEIALRKALFALGLRGWRLHSGRLPGRPDLAFGRWKLAVFVDGAFWHGHSSKFSPGRLSPEWEKKIRANMERDRRADEQLASMGWRVVRLWDFEVRKDAVGQAERVRAALGEHGYPDGA